MFNKIRVAPNKYVYTLDPSERAAMQAIERGELRSIGPQRKRKLRRLGVRVFWSSFLGTYAWNPKEHKRKMEKV